MSNKFQILGVFALAVAVFIGARSFIQKSDAVSVASVGYTSGALASADNSASPLEKVPGSPSNAILGSTGPSKDLFYRVSKTPLPEISSQSEVIADVVSGQKYLDVSSAKRWPTASLAKLMTAVVALEKLDQDATITISDADFADGDNPIFLAGETYKTKDLLKAMLVASRNTAANAIARSYGYEKFIAAMNAKADEWGMNNTNFSDPSGLSVSTQSTAEDLLSLVRRISSDRPEIWRITENAKLSIKDLTFGHVQRFTSTHQFVTRKDFYGGKTGYTPEADQNLISVFLNEGRTVVIIVLGSSDRFGDSEKLLNWFNNDFRASN